MLLSAYDESLAPVAHGALESLEPILIDIANLPDKPDNDAVRVIRQRVERKNIVPLLRVNSTALARALD